MSHILIIEDDPNIADLEKDYLEIEGYDVKCVHDGEKGLQEALTGQYQLIVLDLMLPGMDGFEVCKRIREKIEVPLIIVSAKVEDIDKIRGLGLGADDYMTKPFSPAELVARVKSHIKRYKRLIGTADVSDEITTKGLVIHKKSHRVFSNGKEVSFTAKEFELLSFMASNPNIVFSKDQLFDQIWGIDFYGDIGTVAVHIQKIRKKIERDSSDPKFIETVWGSGYRFNK